MTVHYKNDQVTVHHGDCLDVLAELPDASVDAVVTDPPYGLEFMGKEWDKFGAKPTKWRDSAADQAYSVAHEGELAARLRSNFIESYRAGIPFQQWCTQWATECLRVLKPGGHLVAFGGTRTWHRLACAIEDAGFEIRDSIAWLYGSGFPKSLDVSKAIDKAAGAEREVVGSKIGLPGYSPRNGIGLNSTMTDDNWKGIGQEHGGLPVTAPATDAAKQWQGWGTALKPAFEPIVLARKPIQGTVAANVLAHGCGALNIEGCRIAGCRIAGEVPSVPQPRYGVKSDGVTNFGAGEGRNGDMSPAGAGRWPPNVVLDDAMAAELDRQSGYSRSSVRADGATGGMLLLHGCSSIAELSDLAARGEKCPDGRDARATLKRAEAAHQPGKGQADEGGASRFFPVFKFTAKAPGSERPSVDGVQHPTVKPTSLICWLIRLTCPPGGVVLDPFAGSGTTGEAAILEHKRAILIEREADYLPLIVARLQKPMQVGFDFEEGA